jgi:excisionase family DNA binding protein
MSHTLAEVAEKTGRSQAILRKHIERGKLRATKDGSRVLIEDEALDAYMGSEALQSASDAAAAGDSQEVTNSISRLPPRTAASVAAGLMPTTYQTAPKGPPVDTSRPVAGFTPVPKPGKRR